MNFKTEDITFSYCTEFIFKLDEERIKTNPFTEERLRNGLAKLGDSLVVVHDEDLVKVHVHTDEPGVAMNMAQKYGEFIKLKIRMLFIPICCFFICIPNSTYYIFF